MAHPVYSYIIYLDFRQHFLAMSIRMLWFQRFRFLGLPKCILGRNIYNFKMLLLLSVLFLLLFYIASDAIYFSDIICYHLCLVTTWTYRLLYRSTEMYCKHKTVNNKRKYLTCVFRCDSFFAPAIRWPRSGWQFPFHLLLLLQRFFEYYPFGNESLWYSIRNSKQTLNELSTLPKYIYVIIFPPRFPVCFSSLCQKENILCMTFLFLLK